MDNSAANTDLIRGHVITIILRSLQGNDKYGYEICREIEVKSEGSYVLKQPTLYSCLKRLESQGYITSYWGEISNGGRRRYYSLTEKGEEFLERDKQEWEFSRTLINRLLSDKDYDLTQPPPFNPSDLRPYTRKISTFQTTDELAENQEAIINTVEIPTEENDNQNQSDVQTYDFVESLIKTNDETDELSYDEDTSVDEISQIKSVDEEEAPEQVSFLSPLFYDEPSEDSSTKFRTLDEIFGDNTETEEVEIDNNDLSNTETSNEVVLEEKLEKTAPEEVVRELISEIVEPTETPAVAIEDKKQDDVNYRSAFSKLFDTTDEQTVPEPQPKVEPVVRDEPVGAQSPTISDLKKRYYSEGYNLKQYSRSNVSIFYNMNYVYANKLNTLTYWILYAFILVEIGFTALFESSLGLGLGVYLGAIFTALIIPAVPTVMTIKNPLKRVKADFDLKRSVINRLLLFLNLSLIVACLGVFVWQIDLNNLSTMVKPILLPILYLLNLPFSSVIYYQIYKTKKFHLS